MIRYVSAFCALSALLLSAMLANASGHAYQIKSGDILSVSVWGEPDLSSEVLVLPDQTISFPLVGVISAANKSVSDLISELQSRVRAYVPDANVHVAVKQIRGNKIYVIGKVNRPGEYDLPKSTTVIQALSIAGGMGTFADDEAIKVLRRIDEEEVALAFNYAQVSKGKGLEQNVVLQEGDVVVVP